MHYRKLIAAIFFMVIFSSVINRPASAYTETVLKYGMNNTGVIELQNDLKYFGLFDSDATGYFGSITKSAVIAFQKLHDLDADGIVGAKTRNKIIELKNAENTYTGNDTEETEVIGQTSDIKMLSWFDEVDSIFALGDEATVIDVQTGIEFKIVRSYGGNHADVETLTIEDTNTLKNIAGGSWNWTRRPVIVEVDGVKIAGSMTAMPHAGRDDMPANANVDNRSGDYGRGTNLDTVKSNGMDGHFDIHFYGSKTHSTNRVDSDHQAAILEAFSSEILDIA